MDWCRLDLFGSEKGLVVGCCEHGNEPSGFIKYWERFEHLNGHGFSRS
jgi:hypothetical protein